MPAISSVALMFLLMVICLSTSVGDTPSYAANRAVVNLKDVSVVSVESVSRSQIIGNVVIGPRKYFWAVSVDDLKAQAVKMGANAITTPRQEGRYLKAQALRVN